MKHPSERMSKVDTAWLRMDSERNLMMIVGIWLLRPALAHAALCERLQSKLLAYARFRQKVVQEAFAGTWVDDEDFDLDRHVVRERLVRRPGQGERAALQRRAAELAATPLDPAHPLWQMHLIEHYEDGSALIVRIHHCIADGIALNAVLLSVVDGGVDLHHGGPRDAHPDEHGAHDGDGLVGAVVRPLTGLAVKAIGLYGDGVVAAMHTLAHPQEPLAGSVELARAGVQVLRDAAALALLPDDSPTLLKGPLSGRKVGIFWVPTSGDVGIGVSIVSYAGGVQFGMMTDHRRCPDPQAVIDRFAPEFDQLLLLTLMLPWDTGAQPPPTP